MYNIGYIMIFNLLTARWKMTVLFFVLVFFGNSIQTNAQNAPVTGDDENFTYQDNAVTGNVYDNDYDLDGDELTYSIVSGTPDGTWNLQPNGDYTYIPNQYVTGVEYLIYQACDEDGMCTTGTLTMYVIFLNDAPQANNDSFNAEINSTRTFNLRLNDFEPDQEIMLFYLVVPPANGTASINVSTGVVTYTPNNGYTGPDNFTYQACDPCNVCDQASVSISVLPENASPVFSQVILNATEDTQLTGSFSSYASDADNDNLTYGLITNSQQGSVSVLGNGNFTFTPQANFSGLTSCLIQVCDIVGQCATTVVQINVAAVNDAPTAQNDSATGSEDNDLSGTVSSNDADIDSNPLTYSMLSGPTAGSVEMEADGSFVFFAPENESGFYSFTYQVCDSQNACASASVNISIQPVNDAPTAVADYFITTEDNVLTGTVANDTDIDSPTLTYTYAGGLENGSIEMSSDGSFNYYPNENWFGIEMATYSVCDNQNACSIGTFQITVNYLNDAPIVNNETFTIDEEELLTGDLSTNDDSQGEGSLTYTLSSIVENVEVSIQPEGTFSILPNPDWFGTTVINYSGCNTNNACDGGSITITVLPVNDAPVCSNISIELNEDSELFSNLNLVDDVDDDELSMMLIQGSNGTVSYSGNNNFMYSPAPHYFGEDMFQVNYCDAENLCCTATVSVTIESINDTPITSDGSSNVDEDNTLEGTLPIANDIENQTLNYDLVTAPMNGEIDINSDGTFTYVPDLNYYGVDAFTFRVCDTDDACDAAVMTITIDSVNDLPIVQNESNVCPIDITIQGSVANNDSDTESNDLSYNIASIDGGGSIVLENNGEYTFIPAELGFTTITYQACDEDGGCVNGTLTIETILTNTAPLANTGNYQAFEDVEFNVNISELVADGEGGDFSFSLINTSDLATIALSETGLLTVLGDQNYSGSVSCSYQVCDNGNLCAIGEIFIAIQPVNDAPTASALEFVMYQDHVATVSLNANINDDSNGPFTFELIETNFNGEIEFESDGTITLTPAPYIIGYFDIVYTVCDELGLCDEVTSQVFVLWFNDAPEVEDAAFSTNEEQDYTGTLADYVYEPDLEDLSYAILMEPMYGTLQILSDGTFTYSPDAEFSGFDQFTYMACDESATCTSGTMDIEVVFMNDLPVAIDDFFMVLEDGDIEGTVADNDIELDDETDSYSVYTAPEHGTLTLEANGTFTYTPFANYYGTDEAWIMMCDPCGACDISTLSFEVTFLNDMPVVEDESILVYQNTSYSGSVATNDYELDIEDLTYFIVDDNTGGIFNLEDDGSYFFIPGDDAIGIFTLEYMACDPCGACSFGTLTIEVIPFEGGNTAPTASDFEMQSCVNSTVTIDISPYIFDMQQPDSELSIDLVQPQYGFASVNGTELTYQASDIYVGLITMEYEVCDSGDPSLCTTASIEISVFPNDTPSLTDLYVENVLCYGASDGYIEILGTEALGNVSIEWENGSNEMNQYNLQAGMYNFVLTSDAICSVPGNYQITVGGPSSGIQVDATITGISDNGSGEIELIISGGTEPYDVSWSGASGTNNGNGLIDITTVGTYYVSIEDAIGCSFDTSFTVSGIDEFGDDIAIRVWPNPTSGILNISAIGLSGNGTQIQVINSLGQVITEQSFGSWSSNTIAKFDLNELASGLYQIRFVSNEKSTIYSFIKE
jgi:hypothetical protein